MSVRQRYRHSGFATDRAWNLTDRRLEGRPATKRALGRWPLGPSPKAAPRGRGFATPSSAALILTYRAGLAGEARRALGTTPDRSALASGPLIEHPWVDLPLHSRSSNGFRIAARWVLATCV